MSERAIACSNCKQPLVITFELTERHTLIYCDECLRKMGFKPSADT